MYGFVYEGVWVKSSELELVSHLCVDSKVPGLLGTRLTLILKGFRPWHHQPGHSFWLWLPWKFLVWESEYRVWHCPLRAKSQVILRLLLHGAQGTVRTLLAVIVFLGVAMEVLGLLEQWEQHRNSPPVKKMGLSLRHHFRSQANFTVCAESVGSNKNEPIGCVRTS